MGDALVRVLYVGSRASTRGARADHASTPLVAMGGTLAAIQPSTAVPRAHDARMLGLSCPQLAAIRWTVRSLGASYEELGACRLIPDEGHVRKRVRRDRHDAFARRATGHRDHCCGRIAGNG